MSEQRARAWFCPTRGLHAGGDLCAQCEPVDVLMVSEHERVVAERDRYRAALADAVADVSSGPVSYAPNQVYTPMIAVACVERWRGVLRGEQDNET